MKKIAAAALAALSFAAAPLAAQTTANGSSTVTVPQVLYIGVSATALNFGTVAQADLDAGYKDGGAAITVTHKGNVNHTVQVTAAANTMTGVGTKARTDKPSTDLRFKIGTTAPAATDVLTNQLSTTATAIHAGATPGNYADHETLWYRMMLSYADTEGQYDLNFTYTIIAQ